MDVGNVHNRNQPNANPNAAQTLGALFTHVLHEEPDSISGAILGGLWGAGRVAVSVSILHMIERFILLTLGRLCCFKEK